jgi:hypothetical protein
MPLYTYIATYKGQSYVAQGRHSNFQGFPMWFGEMPATALPALTPALRKEVNLYQGKFEPIQNRKKVWQKTLSVGGSDLTVFVVQTET